MLYRQCDWIFFLFVLFLRLVPVHRGSSSTSIRKVNWPKLPDPQEVSSRRPRRCVTPQQTNCPGDKCVCRKLRPSRTSAVLLPAILLLLVRYTPTFVCTIEVHEKREVHLRETSANAEAESGFCSAKHAVLASSPIQRGTLWAHWFFTVCRVGGGGGAVLYKTDKTDNTVLNYNSRDWLSVYTTFLCCDGRISYLRENGGVRLARNSLHEWCRFSGFVVDWRFYLDPVVWVVPVPGRCNELNFPCGVCSTDCQQLVSQTCCIEPIGTRMIPTLGHSTSLGIFWRPHRAIRTCVSNL